MSSFLNWVPFRVLFIRVPYYIGDRKRDPTFEYPYEEGVQCLSKV